MTTKDARMRLALANELVRRHLSGPWKVQYDRTNGSQSATCNHKKNKIMLNKGFAVIGTDHEFKNTVLHEIAHAIVGPEANLKHGSQWKRIAHQIGYDRNAKSCHPIANEDPPVSFKNKENKGKGIGKKQSNVHVARNIKMNINNNKNKNAMK